MPISVIDKFKPANNAQFPVVDDVDVQGGYQVRGNLYELPIIPTNNRKEGMIVYVLEDGKFYQLLNDLVTWAEIKILSNIRSVKIVNSEIVSSDYTIDPTTDDLLLINNYSGSRVTTVNVYLPGYPRNGESYTIKDISGVDQSPNPVISIYATNGFTVEYSDAQPYADMINLNAFNSSVTVTFDNIINSWRITNSYVPSTGITFTSSL